MKTELTTALIISILEEAKVKVKPEYADMIEPVIEKRRMSGDKMTLGVMVRMLLANGLKAKEIGAAVGKDSQDVTSFMGVRQGLGDTKGQARWNVARLSESKYRTIKYSAEEVDMLKGEYPNIDTVRPVLMGEKVEEKADAAPAE